ncbi:MAG: cyclopropane fatty-acyl-phospholipid synthase-like methyltransferase [Motiliproteus sp.]|jgi:cyclopropane fatty-acyl-phospholipid synthase-like methyltransferase
MRYFSEACERNKAVILEQLQALFSDRNVVLEIGSGSGQHALHLAAALGHLQWQPSEVAGNLAALAHNLSEVRLSNLMDPVCLDVSSSAWPAMPVDAVFSANTLHIISWDEVECFFAGAARLLSTGGKVAVYGPFRYQGGYTSASNAQFDRSLRQRDPRSGIRDAEAVDCLAAAQGLQLLADLTMPANNQLRLWKKV